MIRILSLLTLLFFVGTSCKTYKLDDLPPKQLHFGSGGGFAGVFTSYLLLENGQFFRKDALNGTFEPLDRVKKTQAKALFRQWETAQLAKLDFDHPGNLYHFVTMMTGDTTYRLSWGAMDYPASDAMKSFYESCKKMIPIAQ